jgi:hypothetical protein
MSTLHDDRQGHRDDEQVESVEEDAHGRQPPDLPVHRGEGAFVQDAVERLAGIGSGGCRGLACHGGARIACRGGMIAAPSISLDARGRETVPTSKREENMAKHQQHHDPRSSGRARAHDRVSALHVLGLFVFYTALAFGVFAFTFFYIFTGIEFRLVIVLTLVIGVVATFVHVKAGRRTRVDSLVDKGL